MQTQDNNATITSLAKLEAEPNGVYKRWEDEITFAEKEMGKFWKAARLTIRRYIDDRDATEVQKRWFNAFFTNVGIMEASLYDQTPEASVSRRFLDMDDDVGRVAGNILERCINQDMDEADCDFDAVMRHAVFDRLVPGLGAAWLRLENEFEEIEGQLDPETQEPLKKVASQEVAIDWVFYEDFIFSPCRVWEERRWVARKVYMTRDQLVKRWGEEKGKQVPLTTQSSVQQNLPNGNTPSNMVLKRGCVYEIWDRESRKVIWFAKGMDAILEERDDFLKLRGGRFEPCPKPLFANLTTSNCLPKPDFAMLQDQYNELDEVNNRISLLIIACKVTGVYDQSATGIQRMLTEGYDNTLIPVDNWAMFAEKGGIKGTVDFLPLDMIVTALNQLQAHRQALVMQIDQLTGISDVVRGTTKASETLGAQELKAKYASVRIQRLQQDVTRFAEEILTIKGDIITQHFVPEQVVKMANVQSMVPEDQQLVMPALQLLMAPGENEELCWRVDIQATSMAITDYAAVKNERSEFLNSVATFLQSSATVGQGAPQLIPLMLNMLQFGVAGFRVSKDIEGVFDRYIKEFEQEIEAKKNAPPQPDPEMVKAQQEAQLEQQKAQQEAQLEQQKAQAELAMKQQEFQMEMQQKQQEFLMEMRQQQQEFALKLQQMVMEGQIKREVAVQDSAQNAAMQHEQHQLTLEHQREQQEMKNGS
jgi:hypothetical protein